MNNKIAVLSGLVAIAGFITGCGTPYKAPMADDGGKIKLFVVSDRGNENEMEEKQWGYRNEVGSYMESDVLARLNASGYDVQKIDSKDEFVPEEDSFLLYMRIESYNPGSSAARILVGFGAGSCSLDMHYIVFDESSKKVMEWDDGIGTSGDWHRLTTSLDDKLVRKLDAELAKY